MKLPFQRKLMVLFIILLLFILLIQGYLLYVLKKPFFSSSLISLLFTLSLAYIFSKVLTQPIQRMRKMARQLATGSLEREIQIYPSDEWGELAKAVDEMRIQLKEKIEEISRERDYLKTILKGMVEGVLVVDERGRILMVNDALRKILSLSSEVVDKAPLEAIRNAELEEAIREAVQEGKNSAFELTFPLSGGKTIEVNVVGISPSPKKIDKEGEQIKGAIAVFHDISRLKELEKIRQDFVANVSHELRTPLTTIKGYTETLLDGALKESLAPQFLQVIQKHADRLAKIVEDLLALSKIESKEFYLKVERLPLSELIDDISDFVKEATEKKKISISRSIIPSTLEVMGDRSYLEQVFINLLDNAIKYTHEGGEVSISAFENEQREIQVLIQDNGMGIPKEDLSRIFERFYRVDKGRSQELGGTGLGLSIVKHIIHAHGGRVWVESQPGKGSTFYFTLPNRSDPTK
jgi:two-component system, OmpR family, phosphate regulon sensor histidine kinase PhoR